MRFVHTADNHLDMPLSSLPPLKASLRKAERRASFSKIIDFTLQNADFLIISGDLFHTPSPSQSTINFVKKEFERLGDIPVFIALGNHDYGVYDTNFPGNVHIFTPGFERIVYKDTLITGSSFAFEVSNIAHTIPYPDKDYSHNILVLHTSLTPTGDYNPIDKAVLQKYGYDYVALGHVHAAYSQKNLFFPGCHDGSGFDECGEKGFLYTDTALSPSPRFIPTSSRIYSVIDCDISGCDSSQAICAKLSELIGEGIYRINLTGVLNESFSPNIDYITSVLSEQAFFVTIADKTCFDNDISQSSIFRFFSEYIDQSCDRETALLAKKYGSLALKGVKEDI